MKCSWESVCSLDTSSNVSVRARGLAGLRWINSYWPLSPVTSSSKSSSSGWCKRRRECRRGIGNAQALARAWGLCTRGQAGECNDDTRRSKIDTRIRITIKPVENPCRKRISLSLSLSLSLSFSLSLSLYLRSLKSFWRRLSYSSSTLHPHFSSRFAKYYRVKFNRAPQRDIT